MSIGTPVDQGHANQVSSSTTLNVTTLANINNGDSIIVEYYANSNNIDVASITDSSGNYYFKVVNLASVAPVLSVWVCNNAIAMVAGSTITINRNGSGSFRYGAQIISVSGLSNADVISSSTTGTATSATSVATGTLTAQPELILGCVVMGGNLGTFTPGGSFTQIGSGGPSAWPMLAWQTVSSTSSVAWAPSWVNSELYRSVVLSFFGATTQSFLAQDQTNPVRLAPAGVSLRGHEERPKLTLLGKDVLFGAPGETPTPPDVSNPVLARPNLELRTFLHTQAYFPPPSPVTPVDAQNPLPRRSVVEHPIAPNLSLTTLVGHPFAPFYFENPRRYPFRDAVVCNSAEPLDIIPSFKVKVPDNPRSPGRLPEYPIAPNIITATLAPQSVPFRTTFNNPMARTAAEIIRLGETQQLNIIPIVQQPAPPPDFQNPRGYPYPTAITADPGFQSEQGLGLTAIQPIGQDTFPTDLPVLKTPSFINFDAAPTNLLSGTLLPQPLPPGSDEVVMADLPPRGRTGYSQYEVGSPNATATTLQTVFPPPGIPIPYGELFEFLPPPRFTYTAYQDGCKSSQMLGGALNVPPISDQLIDYFFMTISQRTAYAFLYDAGPPSQLGMVLAPVSAPPGDLYVKQHRMGAPGFPLMGEPH